MPEIINIPAIIPPRAAACVEGITYVAGRRRPEVLCRFAAQHGWARHYGSRQRSAPRRSFAQRRAGPGQRSAGRTGNVARSATSRGAELGQTR